jgi:PAS domain S-box-containing protein
MPSKPCKTVQNNFISLLNFIADPAIIVDGTGRFLVVNDAFIHLIGLKKKELIGTAFFTISNLTAKSRKTLVKNLEKRMNGIAVNPYEIEFTDKIGEKSYAEVKAKKISYNGQPADLVVFHDITRRKENARRLKEYSEKMEALVNDKIQAVKESEEKFRNLSEESPNMIFIYKKGRVIYANKKCEDLMGYTKEEFYAPTFNFFTLIAPESQEKLKSSHTRHAEGQEVAPYEYTLVTKAGKRISAVLTSKLMKYEGEAATLGIVTDITERKKAEEALTDSEEKFRAISTYASDAILLLDKTDQVVYWNLAAEKIFGYTKEEALGKKLRAIVVPPKSHKQHLKMLKKLFKTKTQITENRTEIKALKKDGTEFPIEFSATVLSLKDAQYVLEIIRDVSERKKMEETLKQERDMLEAVTENIGAGLAIISNNYHILWANKLMKQINGDCEGKKCYSTFNKLTDVCPNCGVKKVFENDMPIDIHEYSNLNDKGNRFWIELIVTPIKDEKGKVTAALELAINITERKLMQNKLAEYSQKLEKLVEKRTEQLKQTQAKLVKSERLATIGELAAMVGHDLRNPLTGIKGAAYYLKTKHCSEIGSRGKEMLESIENAIDYSNKIVNDLLEYSRDLKLELAETTPKALLKKALASLEIPEKIRIVDATADEPKVKADTEQMCRVFVNLIKNAIDAMPEGGTLTIRSKEAKGTLKISFKDTGTGMSEKTLHTLKRGVPLFTTKAKGMGFGLPICKRIAEAHGGKLSLESKIGKGTKVTLTMPVNPKPVDEVEENWIFSESMLSKITATHDTQR